MSTTVTRSNASKSAGAVRFAGGTSYHCGRYLVYGDSAGTQKLLLIENTTRSSDTAAYTSTFSGSVTVPAGYTTPFINLYLIGDVGANELSLADAQAAVTAGTITSYILQTGLMTVTGSDTRVAFTTGDVVTGKCVVTES